MPSVRALTGEIVIRSVASDKIVIAVDAINEGRPADGIADSLFYFTAEAPLKQPVALHFRHANLEVRPRSLDVVVPSQGTVLWADIGPPEEPTEELEGEEPGNPADLADLEDWAVAEHHARARLEGQSKALIFEDGIELTEYRGGSQLRLKDLAIAKDAAKVKGVARPGMEARDDCPFGGLNSTACSAGCAQYSCSTSCSSSSYSCCSCSSGRANCSCRP
jgi:hypothetical protein